ncbi:hypothetical protein PHMEG_000989 [Phytophthora megakarya]|uniref:Uncharacterized protein n=1 Tax=Phytophthora megakarya TaxID=4795 RepID=A0A225X2T1_9STRA|nr:hypothetical protein PHMEG_000989 [Phytophthora megakarya]
MGNIASTRLYTRPDWEFTASDMVLDQMEKQCVDTSSTWMETSVQCCALVLSTMTLLMGSLTGSLHHSKTPILVDAACQTEDETFVELTVSRNWEPYHADYKVVDDDNHSCTTETTEVFTDAESEDYAQAFTDDESILEDTNSSGEVFNAICDACESCGQCDSETQAEQLLHLTATVCSEDADVRPIYLEDYLCTCGECPQYKEIAHDVAVTMKTPTQQTQSITRLLQAFSTYNEVRGYNIDMIPTARECLRIWCGDEDKAFKSFVMLYDEVSRLCD